MLPCFEHSFLFTEFAVVIPQHIQKVEKYLAYFFPQIYILLTHHRHLIAVSSKVFQNGFCTLLKASGILLEFPIKSIKHRC